MTRAGEGQLSLFPPDPAPDPLLCWLWLAGTLGAGSQRAGAVLDAFGGAQEAWEARDTDAFAAAAGPAAVGMVGTRKPTEYGLRAAEDIGRGLARAGAVIVSGLADGLDSAGHRAAVGENCPTIAVMGVPIDRTYPAANRELRRAIERRGCVISEYPPESEPVGAVGFLQRNRLIAALSGALVVVEAKEKSGTMSTVGHAERYGKPVFAVPGSIFSPASAGTNALLRDGRAKAVCTAADLFGTLGLQTARPAPAPRETPRPLSENERLVLSCLGAKAQGVEELGVKSGLPTAALLGVLMKLELAGRVSCLPGKRYILRGGSAS